MKDLLHSQCFFNMDEQDIQDGRTPSSRVPILYILSIHVKNLEPRQKIPSQHRFQFS